MSLSGPVQIFASDIHTTDSTPLHPLGTKGETSDGRIYRYAEAGAVALSAGQLVVPAAIVANHVNIAVASAAAVGATEVTVTLGATAATANDYQDGYLIVNDAAGEGIAYSISGNPAADASASLTLQLNEAIVVALTTSSEVSLMKNPYKDVLVSVTDQGDMPIGVPNVAISANEFGWVQTRGVCSALADETLAIGSDLTTGTAVAGALEVVDAVGEPRVGIAIQAGVDTEHRAVFLQIE